jgi:hypothetical protein
MKWLRRIAAVPLVVLALICAIGAVRIFAHDLTDSTFTDGLFAAGLAAAAGAAVFFLLRPELQALRGLSFAQWRDWFCRNPLGQALGLYLVTAVLMLATPEYQLGPAVLAMCVFSLASAWTITSRQRWWLWALIALLAFCALFLALGATSEARAPRGFGEGAMLFLLPLQAFPLLLAVSGIVRLVRGAREPGPEVTAAGSAAGPGSPPP